VLIGASRPEQVAENVAAAKNTAFSSEELARIDSILQ
jgi:L-glyceraldehyde 3-phosphate reductase